ncbi:MAG: D-2-hydroxyacid dehydrogenase, partial [bacterium]|nr:D-2-hydroxyacid dehydrogenase [bacterium]
MKPLSIIVLADPTSRSLGMLEELPSETEIAVGNRVEAFTGVAETADIMVTRMVPVELVRAVWQMAPRLRWVHSLSAGVNNSLFEELIHSPVPLTNARGVYSRSLGEFALTGALFFAKDLRRMMRQQAAGR